MTDVSRSWWAQLIFKIRIGKYHWGSLQEDVYTNLNGRYQTWQFPQRIRDRIPALIRRNPVKKISVVIATRNRPDILYHYAIASLLRSVVHTVDYEVVVVDNSSNDLTEAWLIPFCAKHDRFRYICQREKKSTTVSRNRGIEVATGDVVAFIDDDCRVDQNWLERLAQAYRRGPYIAGRGYIFDTLLQRQLVNEQSPYFECRFFSGNLSFRRDVFNFVQFNEAMEVSGEDRDLVYRLSMLWLDFPHFVDRVSIEHVRAASEYRDGKLPQLNRTGARLDFLMDQLWWVNRFIVRRNAKLDQYFFSMTYWLREVCFLPADLFLVRGQLRFLLRDKWYIYCWLQRLKKIQ